MDLNSRAPVKQRRMFYLREHNAMVLLAMFIAFLVMAAFYWMQANTAPPPWDQSWYLETSERLMTTLDVQGFRAFVDNYMHAFSGTKAPLISLLPLPFYWTIGHGKLAVELTLLIQIVLFCLILFRLVRVLAGPWEALVAVIVTNTMPLAIGLAHEFLVEYGLMLLVTLWILLLVYSHGYRVMRCNFGLGIVLGLGLLMKADFPLYIVGPAVFALYRRWREDGFVVKSWIRDLGTMSALGFLIAGTWYLPNLSQLFRFVYSTSVGNLSVNYAIRSSGPNPLMATLNSIGVYWTNVTNLVISTYYVLVFVAAFVMMILVSFVSKRQNRAIANRPIRHQGVPLLILWFVIPYIVFSLSINKDYRYGLPATPALGILLSLLLFRALPWSRIRSIALPALLAFPLLLFCNVTFPVPSLPYIANQRWILLSKNLGYAARPVDQPWPQVDIIQQILADAKKRDSTVGPSHMPRVLLVVDLNYYNQNNFSYYAAYLKVPLIFSAVLTQSERDWPDRRNYLLHSEYALTKESGDQGPAFTTFMNAQIRQMLATGALPFEPVTQFHLPDGSTSILYRNTELTNP